MTSFRTKTTLPPYPFSIDHQNSLLCIGSCFSENIGARLVRYKFPCLINPFGVLYNPISIQQTLHLLMDETQFKEADLFFHLDLWHSFFHHGRFSHPDKKTALANINSALEKASHFVKTTSRLLLTFGTANVFVLKSNHKIVANCHKVPADQFEKRRLTTTEIIEAFLLTLRNIKQHNPALEVILTVSPVRHIRNGLIENQRSKATLLLAVEALASQLDFVHYFPAYEILLDDLRDYRFYNKDLIHPNVVAVDYIWEDFQQAFFSEQTKMLLKKIEKIIQASEHRPFHPQTNTHREFVLKQLQNIQELEREYEFLDFEKEKSLFGFL